VQKEWQGSCSPSNSIAVAHCSPGDAPLSVVNTVRWIVGVDPVVSAPVCCEEQWCLCGRHWFRPSPGNLENNRAMTRFILGNMRIRHARRSLFLALFLAVTAAADINADFARFLEDEWAARQSDNPFLEDVIESESPQPMTVSPQDYARRLQVDQRYYRQLLDFDRSQLPPANQLNYDILEFVLRYRIELAGFQPYRMPFVSSNGFFNNIAITLTQSPRHSAADVDLYIERIQALPAYFDQQISNMRYGLQSGFTMPREIMDGVLGVVAAQVVERYDQHPLWAPFESLPAGLTHAQRERFRDAGRKAIESLVMPGYEKVYNFFVDEYLPDARTTVAAIDLPKGRDYYRHLLRFNTTLEDADPDAIHATGLEEVTRIRSQMQDIMREVDFAGDLPAFFDFLRTDPQFYANSAEELLKESAYMAKRIDGILPAYFNKLPRAPYGVFPVPADLAPNYTTGRYWWPPIDGSTGGRYLVNTYALDKRPLYNVTALTLHEAVPGHHLQVALSQEVSDAAEFRSYLYLMGHAEGWGLYCEKLGLEMGVYDTPYDRFGQLTYEMWRATRLVVDTGLHWKGWSREQAVQYMLANSALSELNIRTEIDRYVATPGQATAYKMGEIKIWELRRKAEAALGTAFNLGAFHDIIIADGSMPLSIVERRVDAYIDAVKTSITAL
jgi:uncharacterized protein (DUF885 family)